MKPEVKKIIAVVVGMILAALGAYLGIDFKESIPSVPSTIVSHQ